MISYSQYWGTISVGNAKIGDGYSGHFDGYNNPKMEAVKDKGPIPRGKYRILRWYDDPKLGPCTAELVPMGHDAHGRSGFRIHGDNLALAHAASHGCIIAPRDTRHALRDCKDLDLEVTE